MRCGHEKFNLSSTDPMNVVTNTKAGLAVLFVGKNKTWRQLRMMEPAKKKREELSQLWDFSVAFFALAYLMTAWRAGCWLHHQVNGKLRQGAWPGRHRLVISLTQLEGRIHRRFNLKRPKSSGTFDMYFFMFFSGCSSWLKSIIFGFWFLSGTTVSWSWDQSKSRPSSRNRDLPPTLWRRTLNTRSLMIIVIVFW